MSKTQKLPDFSTFYSDDNLKKWQIPAFADVSPVDGIFRRPYIKWSELGNSMDPGQEIDLFYICTDVLEIDREVNLETGAFLFARRIILADDARLVLKDDNDLVSLLVVTNQITDQAGKDVSLSIVQIDGGGAKRASQISATSKEGELSVFEIFPGETELKHYPVAELDPAYLMQGEPLRMFLRSELHLGILLLHKYPIESIHQFDYVGAVAGANPETQIMAGEARALAANLRATQAVSNNGLLVPLLDYSIYADSAAKALTVLKVRQEQYDRLLDSANNLEQWKANAELAFGVGDEQEALTKELLLKAEKTRRQMEQARAIAARQVAAIQVSLIYKRKEFEDGVELWKEKHILKDIFKMIVGVVKILAEIPTIVATGPAAVGDILKTAGAALSSLATIGAGLAESAVDRIRPKPINLNFEDGELDDMADIIEGRPRPVPPPEEEPDVDEIVDSFESVDAKALAKAEKARKAAEAKQKETTKKFLASAKNVGAAGKEIADAALDIAAVVKQAAQMEAASQQALLAINRGVDNSFSDIIPRGLDVVTGGSQEWEKLSLLVKAFFDKVPDDVPGKSAFQQEYDRLIISAQAMCQARLALARANSDVAEAMIRLKSAQKTKALYEHRLESLKEKVTSDQVLSQLAYNKILDAKRSVYLYLEAYRRAFIYYTLQTPKHAPTLPDLSASYDVINQNVSNITNARLANESIQRAPRNMNKVEHRIFGNALTEEFRQKGVLQFSITPDDQLFEEYCRIRIHEMEVYLEGYSGNADVKVELTNNGVYMDKDFSGRIRHFVAAEFKSKIRYNPSDPSKGFTGGIDDRFKAEYSLPAPFSTWTVVFKSADKREMDLSGVSAVKVIYSGYYSVL